MTNGSIFANTPGLNGIPDNTGLNATRDLSMSLFGMEANPKDFAGDNISQEFDFSRGDSNSTGLSPAVIIAIIAVILLLK